MKIILFLISLLFFGKTYCQNDKEIIFNPEIEYTQEFVDSLVSNDIVVNPIEFKKILESDEKLIGWMRYYKFKYKAAYVEGKKDSALFYSNKYIEAYSNAEIKRPFDEKQLVSAYSYKGNALMELQNYNSSLINYAKALELGEKYPFKWRSYSLVGIARSHLLLGDSRSSLKYFLEASQDTLFMSRDRPAISTLHSIAMIYEELKEIDKSKEYYKKSIKISNSSDYKGDLSTSYGNVAGIFHNEKQTDSAVFYYKKAIVASNQYGIPVFKNSKLYNRYFIAYVEFFDGSIKESQDILIGIKKELENYNKIEKPDKDLMIKVIELLAMTYHGSGDFVECEVLLNETALFLERSLNEQLNENLLELETKYQTNQKDASITQLEDNRLQQETIIKQQKTIAFGLSGLLLILSGFGYLFWRQRKLKNQYEKENLEQRLLRSQMNPHFIGNSMNTISALVDKQSEDTIPYINKLSNLFRLVLTNSREEFVNLDDEIAMLNSYLELQSNFSKDFDFSFNIDSAIDQENYIIPPMLIQPFVENAILHGLKQHDDRGKVDVKITKSAKGLLLCKINDNGVGYTKDTESRKRKSVSSDIIKERLEILKKKFKVNSRFLIKDKDQGTLVELYLPYLLDT